MTELNQKTKERAEALETVARTNREIPGLEKMVAAIKQQLDPDATVTATPTQPGQLIPGTRLREIDDSMGSVPVNAGGEAPQQEAPDIDTVIPGMPKDGWG